MRETKQIWFEETEAVYQEVLKLIALNLNDIHSVGFSLRFWDVFIGSWLREFTELVMLQLFDAEKSQIQMSEWKELPTITSLVKYRKLSKSTEFIENLRFDIFNETSIENKVSIYSQSIPKFAAVVSNKPKLGRRYLSATYLSRKVEGVLQIFFGRLPTRLIISEPPLAPVDKSLRTPTRFSSIDSSQKSKIIISLIPKYLPTVYLESFNFLVGAKKPWRGKRFPRVIFTANRHLYDDVFNFWTALAVENGSKLIIGQHGGYYGLSEFPSSFERHEFDIADRYISWGWNSKGISIAGPALMLVNQRLIKRINPHLLIVVTDQLFTYPRSIFGDIDESSPYLSNVQTLARNLEHINKNVLIRLPITHGDSGHSQIDWFNENLPETAIDTGEQKFRQLLKQAKLVVIPHNGTTLIESIALGVPTVIFWDKSIVWMRPEAQAVFNALEQVGIFHRTPESVASFINSIWDDVDGWWNSPATLDARKQFTDQYARAVPNPIRFLAKALQF